MMRPKIFLFMFAAALLSVVGDGPVRTVEALQQKRFTVRTENYPRPPYSGATYYIYEREGEVVCTKLEVCNKFGDCERTYRKGSFKDEIDIETGEPYGTTGAVPIPASKLRKHACLTRFKLVK
jgi:hypothetical protein